MLEIRRILVPVDFSEKSERALDYAIEFAKKFGASVTLVHAYEIPVYGYGLVDASLVASPDLAARISDAAQKTLDALVASRADRGVPIQGILRNGVAWEEIANVAKETHADLIVIGTHGRRGLARALLGSVAESVIRTSDVPVLTIHAPADEG